MKGYTCTILTLALAGGSASADLLTFVPPSANLDDLNHAYAYAWCLSPSLPAGQVVTSVKLVVTDVYDWQVEQNDLVVDLLNNPPAFGSSTTTGTVSNYLVTKSNTHDLDTYWERPGAWGGWQRMFSWSDADGPATENDLDYDFSNLYVYNQDGTQLLTTTPSAGAGLTGFVNYLNSGGSVGLGFAPACHFFNSGVELEITTAPSPASVPGPLAGVPFAVGLLVAVRRRR